MLCRVIEPNLLITITVVHSLMWQMILFLLKLNYHSKQDAAVFNNPVLWVLPAYRAVSEADCVFPQLFSIWIFTTSGFTSVGSGVMAGVDQGFHHLLAVCLGANNFTSLSHSFSRVKWCEMTSLTGKVKGNNSCKVLSTVCLCNW